MAETGRASWQVAGRTTSRALLSNRRLSSPIMVRTVSDIMRTINEKGVAILFNEQNAKLSFALSHRGYLLESGRVVLSGSGEEMLDHPEVKRVYLGQKTEGAA